MALPKLLLAISVVLALCVREMGAAGAENEKTTSVPAAPMAVTISRCAPPPPNHTPSGATHAPRVVSTLIRGNGTHAGSEKKDKGNLHHSDG